MSKKSKKRVFIVEDSEAAVLLLCEMLEDSHYKVCGTASGCDEAVEKISESRPDAVIMDIKLEGGKSGIDAAREIKEIIKIPMVYTSALFSAEILEEIRKTGGLAYIMKPVRQKDLLVALDIAIHEHAKVENLKEIMTARSENFREELEVSRKYEFMANTASEFMTLISKDYIYESVNDAFVRACGKKRSEIIGKPVAAIWGKNAFSEIIKTKLDECFSGKEIHYHEWLNFPAMKKNFFEIEYYPYRKYDKDITHAVVVTRNITERKRMEGILLEQEKLAGIGRLAAGVAHELNNPLTTVLTRIELLMFKSGDTLSAEDKKDMTIIKGESLRMKKIIGDLHTFSRKNIRTEKHEIDLNELIRKVQGLMSADIARSGITIENKLSVIPAVKADTEQIMQVFINLFSNSIDALNSRFLTNKKNKTICVSTKSFGKNGFVRIKVKDNGAGIDEKTQKSLFEPFFTTKSKGTGLGLSIVYGIIKEHGGTIEVRSGKGEYTEFTIDLPVDGGEGTMPMADFIVKSEEELLK